MNSSLAMYLQLCLRIRELGELAFELLYKGEDAPDLSWMFAKRGRLSSTKRPMLYENRLEANVQCQGPNYWIKIMYHIDQPTMLYRLWSVEYVELDGRKDVFNFGLYFHDDAVRASNHDFTRHPDERECVSAEELGILVRVLERVVVSDPKPMIPGEELNIWKIIPHSEAEAIIEEIIASHDGVEELLAELNTLCAPKQVRYYENGATSSVIVPHRFRKGILAFLE